MEKINFYSLRIVDFLESILGTIFGDYVPKKLIFSEKTQYYLLENKDTSEKRLLAVLPDANVFSLYAYRTSGNSNRPFHKAHGIEVENGNNGSAGVLNLLKYVFLRGKFNRDRIENMLANKLTKVYQTPAPPEPALSKFYLSKTFKIDEESLWDNMGVNKYLEQTRAMQISDLIACKYLQVLRGEPMHNFGKVRTPSYLGFKNASGGYELCSLRIGESRTISVMNRKLNWFHVRDFTFIRAENLSKSLVVFWDFWDFLSAEQINFDAMQGKLLTENFNCLILNRHFDAEKLGLILDNYQFEYIREAMPDDQMLVLGKIREEVLKRTRNFHYSKFRGEGYHSVSDKLIRFSEDKPCGIELGKSLFKMTLEFQNALGQKAFLPYFSIDSIAERKYFDKEIFLKTWQKNHVGLDDLRRKYEEYRKRVHYFDKGTGEIKEDFVLKKAYLNANQVFDAPDKYGNEWGTLLEIWS